MSHRPSLISVGAVVLAGCSAGSPAESALEDLPEWTLEETLRIGHLEDPDLGFSRVGTLRVGPDGSIFVLETQERQIRIFDPQGEGRMVLGGQGDGPGEFQFPAAMGILGDTLWVRDAMARRITLFSLAGELLSTIPSTGVALELGDPPVRVTASPGEPRADGTFAGVYSITMNPDTTPVDRFVGNGFPEADVRRSVDRNVAIPDFLPPVTRALLGEDGSLWLQREEDRADDWRWNVFDADGEPTGIVRTPRSFDIQVADDDEIWGVHTDDFGVPWVVGYRIVQDELADTD